MTVLEQAKTLRLSIDRRDALRFADRGADEFRERCAELQVQRTTILATLARLRAMQEKNIDTGVPPATVTVSSALRAYRERLGTDANDARREAGRLKAAINKLAERLTENAESAFDRVLKSIPSVDEAFLRQVELIPMYRDEVLRIREARTRLIGGATLKKMSPEAVSEFLDRRSELAKLADGLNPQEFPKEVVDFFRAARSGGAPLEKLTEVVRKWLKDRDQLKNVRVMVLVR